MLAQAHDTNAQTSPYDMRRKGFNPASYVEADLKLYSTKPFTVECGGETVLRSKEVRRGKHSICILAGSNLGEIEGKAPVYASAK